MKTIPGQVVLLKYPYSRACYQLCAIRLTKRLRISTAKARQRARLLDVCKFAAGPERGIAIYRKNGTVSSNAGRPYLGQRPGEDDGLVNDRSGHQIRCQESYPATAELEGDIEALALWAGQGVGLVNQVQPAGEIERKIAHEARRAIQALAAWLNDRQPG